jgi:hypothetical protein
MSNLRLLDKIAVVLVAVPQLLLWLFTASMLDGEVIWWVYSVVLWVYWGVAWQISAPRHPDGWSLARVLAVSGWLPPIGCALWLLFRSQS